MAQAALDPLTLHILKSSFPETWGGLALVAGDIRLTRNRVGQDFLNLTFDGEHIADFITLSYRLNDSAIPPAYTI